MWYASKAFLRMTFIEVNYFKEKIVQPKELNKHTVSRMQVWFNTHQTINVMSH